MRLLIERQTRSWNSSIFSFEVSMQKRGLCNWPSLFGRANFWQRSKVLQHAQKEPLTRWLIKSDRKSIVDLMVYVMESFNLLIPDEIGLLYKLKATGLKVGKLSQRYFRHWWRCWKKLTRTKDRPEHLFSPTGKIGLGMRSGESKNTEGLGYIYVHVHVRTWMVMLIGLMVTAAGVALLTKVLKGSIWPLTNSMNRGRESAVRIIEIDEYEIVDEIQNQASQGYKVKIHDG